MIQNEFPLVRGIIDAFLFLETSGPDEVNADSAARCMESISASVLALEHSDQLTLRSNLEKIANEAQDYTYSDFARKLPDMIGLASP